MLKTPWLLHPDKAMCDVFRLAFGGVPFREAARQMAAAFRHYLEPPHCVDWDFLGRQLAMHSDDGKQVSR
jgi:hypothetical protein